MDKNKISSIVFYFSILAFIISFNFAHNPPGGWYQQFLPNLNGASITDITFVDSLTGYAVTNSPAYILKTTNGGDNWNIKFSNNNSFVRIQFINQTTGFTNAYQTIFKTTNAGENWNAINLPGDLFGDDMWALNEDTIWLAQSEGLVGGLFRTTNGGQSWQRQYYLFGQNPDKVYMFNRNIGFICRQNDPMTLIKTTNSGQTWNQVPGGPFYDIYFIDSLRGWKAYGNMKYTSDGGLNWINQSLPQGGVIFDGGIINFNNINKDTIWGVGGIAIINNNSPRGIILRTTNGGINWFYQIPDTSIRISQYSFINFSDKLTGWAYRTSPTGIHTKVGGDSIFTKIKTMNNQIPENFILYQNYPNPFNPNTIINYELRITNFVTLKVYNALGKELQTLVNQKQSAIGGAGKYEVEFDGTNLPSGVYFYSLFINGDRIDTKKMVLVR